MRSVVIAVLLACGCGQRAPSVEFWFDRQPPFYPFVTVEAAKVSGVAPLGDSEDYTACQDGGVFTFANSVGGFVVDTHGSTGTDVSTIALHAFDPVDVTAMGCDSWTGTYTVDTSDGWAFGLDATCASNAMHIRGGWTVK